MFHKPAQPLSSRPSVAPFRGARSLRRCARRLPLLSLLVLGACAGHRTALSSRAPRMLIGDFRDDYQGRFTITDSAWLQPPRNRFRIDTWNSSAQFLIAQNAPDDPTAPNLWTRIDWISFTDQQPYDWGFCLTAYKAPTRAAALATRPASHDTPRTGCNGFPFTRMQRVAATDSSASR